MGTQTDATRAGPIFVELWSRISATARRREPLLAAGGATPLYCLRISFGFFLRTFQVHVTSQPKQTRKIIDDDVTKTKT
jgi:hypothetical protein